MSDQSKRDAENAAGEPGGTGDGMLNVVPDTGSAGDSTAFGEAAGSAGDDPEQGPEVAGSAGMGEITGGGADGTLSDARGTGGTGDMGPE
ncbi:MAG TPA: hypothetical protein VK689_00120 [Armatimonadota bacterium]|nr:hypothetical protein [Armatimonadota bacterium]